MRRILSVFFCLCLFLTTNITCAQASVDEILSADAMAIAPVGSALNHDFKLVSAGPSGSQIQWEVLINGSSAGRAEELFDAEGNYYPEIGDGAFYCTLLATLSYGGQSLEKSYEILSFRTPRYRLNGLLYQKPDGTVVRHPYPGSTIIGADVEKNKRVKTDETLIVGVYRGEQLKSISYKTVTKSGIVPLNCELGTDLTNLETRIFLWNGMNRIKPLSDTSEPLFLPKISQPMAEREQNFFKTATVTASNGEDASAVLDSDLNTVYRFSNQPKENTHGVSLSLIRSRPSASAQMAYRTFSDPLCGNVTIEYDFLVTEITQEKGILYLYDTEENIVLSLLMLGSTLQNQNTAVIYNNILPYCWYTLRVELDTDAQTADVFVNDTLCYEKLPFRSKSDSIHRMQMHNSAGNACGMYVDDITVTENARIEFSDNFNSLDEGILPSGWETNGQYRQEICTKEFTDEILSIFPQEILIDAGREFELGSMDIVLEDGIKIRYYIEVSRDTEHFVRVASQMDSYASGVIQNDFGTVRAQLIRLLIYEARDENNHYTNAVIREIKPETAEHHAMVNIAPDAYITVSSEATSTTYDMRGITDGITAAVSKTGEWISHRESNPKVFFSWDDTQTVKELELFGRMTQGETADGALICFDDGTSLTVSGIPANGLPKRVIFPTQKQVNWMSIELRDSQRGNIGLSEVRILSQKEENPVSYLTAWKEVMLPEGYGGEWVVSDDLNNDGKVEFVSCRGAYDENENHGVSAACAVDLNGNVIWTWGTLDSGTKIVGSDMACQIYDINQDGNKEVLLATNTELLILNGTTGEQMKSYPLPECETHKGMAASDSIAIADISGKGYPTDILVKNRYSDVWAYTSDWKLLWHSCKPNNMKTGHYPKMLDIDNDGRDEVLAGFGFIDDDGSLISAFDQSEYHTEIRSGHVDCMAVLRYEKGMPKEQMRFIVTPCGAGNFFLVDGNGKKLWEETSDIHYETLIPGKFTEDGTAIQILTNPTLNASAERGGGGYAPACIYNYDPVTDTCTLHKELWGFQSNRYLQAVNVGGETDLIYSPSDNFLTDANRKVRVQLVSHYRDAITSMRWETANGYHNDMDGDGTPDIVSISLRGRSCCVSIYLNPDAKKTAAKLGTGYNYTYY